MARILPYFFFLTGVDHQLWSKCSPKNKRIELAGALVRYYFLTMASYLLFSFFQLNFTWMIAVLLSVVFVIPLYLIYLSFGLFTYPKRYKGGYVNALFLTRMFKFMVLFLVFLLVSKGLDIFVAEMITENTVSSTIELIASILKVNDQYPYLKLLTLFHISLFFFPVILPFFQTSVKGYASLQLGMDGSISEEENSKVRTILNSEYKTFYLKYKGIRRYQEHHIDGVIQQHMFSVRPENRFDHTLFLHDWNQHK